MSTPLKDHICVAGIAFWAILVQYNPYSQPMTMPGLHQAPSKKTISQQEFLSPTSGLTSAKQNNADYTLETPPPPIEQF
jgi:hypothetical protein